MKKIYLFLVIWLIFLICACNKSMNIDIPLLVQGDDGFARRAQWNTKENRIEYTEPKVLSTKDYSGEFFWDGKNRLILPMKAKEPLYEQLDLDIYRQEDQYILYYKDTTLKNIEKKIYTLSKDGKDYTFDLESGHGKPEFDLSDCVISSYMVSDDELYILWNRFSKDINAIELIITKVDYKTGGMSCSKVKQAPGFSPATPPMICNILQTDKGFIAFNEKVVVLIDIHKNEVGKIIENKDLAAVQEESRPIIDKVGFYEDYIIVRAYRFAKTSDVQEYKLYLVDNSSSVLEIEVTDRIYFPNFES